MKVKSKKPRYQRRALYHVKNHEVHKLMTVPIDIPLQEEWGITRLPLRKDDSVRVIKGEFKDIEGKVLEIFKKERRITIEECTFEKKSGQTGYQKISISKVLITKFADKKGKIDPWREKIIARKSKLELDTSATKKGK